MSTGTARTEVDARIDATRRLAAIDAVESDWKRHAKRNDRINTHLRSTLRAAGLVGGAVLEIGAREHSRLEVFEPPRWRYSVLDIEDCGAGVPVIVGDITSCPELPDASFDVIVSGDVLEHVNRPWLAATEIERLLRPGGISYTSTPFCLAVPPRADRLLAVHTGLSGVPVRRTEHDRVGLRHHRTPPRHPGAWPPRSGPDRRPWRVPRELAGRAHRSGRCGVVVG